MALVTLLGRFTAFCRILLPPSSRWKKCSYESLVSIYQITRCPTLPNILTLGQYSLNCVPRISQSSWKRTNNSSKNIALHDERRVDPPSVLITVELHWQRTSEQNYVCCDDVERRAVACIAWWRVEIIMSKSKNNCYEVWMVSIGTQREIFRKILSTQNLITIMQPCIEVLHSNDLNS